MSLVFRIFFYIVRLRGYTERLSGGIFGFRVRYRIRRTIIYRAHFHKGHIMICILSIDSRGNRRYPSRFSTSLSDLYLHPDILIVRSPNNGLSVDFFIVEKSDTVSDVRNLLVELYCERGHIVHRGDNVYDAYNEIWEFEPGCLCGCSDRDVS